ncbi:MAG: hypothetical protein K8T20_19700 [Planctomycetes bacterium]|nr:hypothetical protein [Planctomycetota bacterium]
MRLKSLLGAAILVLSLDAVGRAEDPEFMISYWGGPPGADSTLQRYKEVADCGFNVAMPPANGADLKANLKILDACKAVGMKAIIQDWRLDLKAAPKDLTKTLDAIMKDYAAHPALAGYMITDEPNASLFPAIATASQYLLKKDPTRLPFINLFPNYATPDQLGSANYAEHVSKYIETVKPKLVSWDHYLQMKGNDSLYFENMEIVRSECQKAKLPFMQIILSLPHWSYRNPTEADLRWQVFTSIAYGAKGIMYFTYWVLPEWKLGDGPAIMKKDGTRDEKYEMVRKINKRLKALGPTLMKLESTGVFCTDPLPPGTRKLADDAPVKKAEGGAFVIGVFSDKKNERYVMVTNRSFTDKVVAKLTLDPATVSTSEISQETGKPLEATALTASVLESTLEAGEGKLYRLNPK